MQNVQMCFTLITQYPDYQVYFYTNSSDSSSLIPSSDRRLEELQTQLEEQRERVARSEESRRQEQTRAEQELADTKEKLQGEVASLQEKITQLVR